MELYSARRAMRRMLFGRRFSRDPREPDHSLVGNCFSILLTMGFPNGLAYVLEQGAHLKLVVVAGRTVSASWRSTKKRHEDT